jgi:uncharacterized protein YycO
MDELAQIGLVRTTGLSSCLIRIVTHSDFNHVIVRVSEHNVVSAETTGVAILPVTHFTNVAWSDFPLTDRQQAKIIAYALAEVGVPYGVLTYLWIGVSRLTRWATPRWLERIISDQHTMICSQLADSAYQHAGVHLFRDHRPPGAVVPGDIGQVFYDFNWVDKP